MRILASIVLSTSLFATAAAAIPATAAAAAATPATATAAAATTPSLLSTTRVTVASSLAPPHSAAGPVEYDPTNITSVGGYAHTDEVSIAMGGGTANRGFSIDLQAPTGTTLHPGSYYGDDIYGVRGNASLIDGNDTCQGVEFTVLDIASSGTMLTRLDVRFQTSCGGSDANAILWGELQLGEPEPVSGIVTGARALSWPDVPVGVRSAALLPLWFRNTGSSAVTAGTMSATGAGAGDFSKLSDNCSHRTLAAHTSCSVLVAFAPHAAGTRTAQLSLPIGSKAVTTTVSGTGTPGWTLLRATSAAGNFIGQGRSYLITDAQFQMTVGKQDPGNFDAITGGDQWLVRLDSRTGGPITTGTHAVNTDPTLRSGYFFTLTAMGRSCGEDVGSVTVKQAVYDADNAPLAFDMTFSIACSAGGPLLTGEWAYHATTATPIPSAPFILRAGASLAAGHSITNTLDGGGASDRLAVTAAGQAVLTDGSGKTVWSTPASVSNSHNRLTVRTDGTLALLNQAGVAVWATPTSGSGSTDYLVLQSDDNLVLYNGRAQPVWATGTAETGL